MGTMLQKNGLELGEKPEVLGITAPEQIQTIHRAYLEAGANIVYANTFGANRHKLEGCGYSVAEIVSAAIKNAKIAAQDFGARVALDIGPIGQLLEPIGTLRFEEAYDIFREMVVAAEEADLIVVETMTDLYEAKAALLAAKENSTKPVFVTMTFEENGRTFTGCSVSSMAMTLCQADAIGFNCSLGPKDLVPLVEELARFTDRPIIVKPNAGLPNLADNTYDINPQEFASQVQLLCNAGATIVGGCCGTTPDYIREMKETLTIGTRKSREKIAAVCSARQTVMINCPCVIGERINPTGKKRFQQALREHDIDFILSQASEQIRAGAEILDVNVGLPGIDEKAMMVEVIKALQGITDAPLQIDSTKPEVIEAALRVYNGKAIVNSVNGEEASLSQILPIVARYGAAVVGLTLDENGIPKTAEERVAIAERIITRAKEYGIPKEDVFIDCLTLTASAEQAGVYETLKALKAVKERFGVKTVLGVSNISFGLPSRELVNANFLTMAMTYGLDLPIINPNIASMMGAVRAYHLLMNHDENATRFIAAYGGETSAPTQITTAKEIHDIPYCVAQGLKAECADLVRAMLETVDPMVVVNKQLIPALDTVGTRFEKGEVFLPQLIRSAEAASAGFEAIKEAIAKSGIAQEEKGKIIVATVKGDIHDIGKNIVKVLLENYGYTVIDLGRDVPPETVVETAVKQNVALVGLSALMTTTLGSMEETIRQLRAAGHNCKIMVGGAVLTPEYAEKIGADHYAKDAKRAVDIAKEVFGK
ncbi:MAG: homocysteine methyltransferase [Ruminococcaceae bacterium]|nr:homocysteine methyltransferase [Oscillospiraceae bacterium]